MFTSSYGSAFWSTSKTWDCNRILMVLIPATEHNVLHWMIPWEIDNPDKM